MGKTESKFMAGKSKKSKQLSVPDYMHLLFPPETLRYFDWLKADIKEGEAKYLGEFGFDDQYTLVFQEKSFIPPKVSELAKGRAVRTKVYTDISITDFPIRGRKTILRFRIRKWQIQGEPGIYQNSYQISALGVKYTREFAFFF